MNDTAKDLSFGAAMFGLITSQLGIKVEPVVPGDFAWNRIVHDVVLRGMNEALSCSSGIIGVRDVPRVRHAGRSLLKEALRADLALVSNPFVGLAEAFDSQLLRHSAEAYVEQKNRIRPERLKKLLAAGVGDDGPPQEKERELTGDGGGGGSFIHINIRDDREVVGLMSRSRKLKL